MAESTKQTMDSSCENSRTHSESEHSPLINSRRTSTPTFDRPSSIFTRAVICILFTELCERLTFYGISGNLQLFASDKKQLSLSPQMASTISYIFSGTCFMLPVLGGWLADSVAGKFSVILFSGVIYLLGTLMLPLGSISEDDRHVDWAVSSVTIDKTFKRVIYICGLFFVAMGTGGIKANVSPFGAEQVFKKGPESVQRFFIWFYWFVNIGAIIAFTFVVYVQQIVSYFYGYLIPACSIVVALIIFLSGKPSYQLHHPAGSVLTTTLKIVMEAAKRSRARYSITSSKAQHWLDRAKQSFGGSYNNWEVEDVKKVYRLIPIFSTFTVYWMVYAQMNTSVVYQGQYMDISFTPSFQIPIASLSVFDTIAVLSFIPIMDKIVYPLLAKCNIRLGRLHRIGIGMVITTLSMVCAGGIELLRVDQCCMEQHRLPDNNITIVSNITIFYQVPQYALIGLSEVFTSVTGLELAYTEAPQSLQGVIMGVFLLTTGLGSYLGAGVVAVVNAISGYYSTEDKWYPNTKYINKGKLAYYFFLLAGLMFLNFILYIFVALSFSASKAAATKAHKVNASPSSTQYHENGR